MRGETKAALQAVREAGKISLKYFGGSVPYRMKPDNSPVTAVDRMCESTILKILNSKFPHYSVLSEECGLIEKSSSKRWIIDPIDGTKAFMRGLPFYGNMIALEEDSEITIGAINMPALGKTIYAEKGKGTHENGNRLRVSNISGLGKSFIIHGRGKGFLEKGYLKKLRKLLDAVYHSWGMGEPYAPYLIASGRVEAFIETFPHPWDVAAPKIIVSEAGGKFSDLEGRDTLHSNSIAISSNGKIHDALMQILKK